MSLEEGMCVTLSATIRTLKENEQPCAHSDGDGPKASNWHFGSSIRIRVRGRGARSAIGFIAGAETIAVTVAVSVLEAVGVCGAARRNEWRLLRRPGRRTDIVLGARRGHIWPPRGHCARFNVFRMRFRLSFCQRCCLTDGGQVQKLALIVDVQDGSAVAIA